MDTKKLQAIKLVSSLVEFSPNSTTEQLNSGFVQLEKLIVEASLEEKHLVIVNNEMDGGTFAFISLKKDLEDEEVDSIMRGNRQLVDTDFEVWYSESGRESLDEYITNLQFKKMSVEKHSGRY